MGCASSHDDGPRPLVRVRSAASSADGTRKSRTPTPQPPLRLPDPAAHAAAPWASPGRGSPDPEAAEWYAEAEDARSVGSGGAACAEPSAAALAARRNKIRADGFFKHGITDDPDQYALRPLSGEACEQLTAAGRAALVRDWLAGVGGMAEGCFSPAAADATSPPDSSLRSFNAGSEALPGRRARSTTFLISRDAEGEAECVDSPMASPHGTLRTLSQSRSSARRTSPPSTSPSMSPAGSAASTSFVAACAATSEELGSGSPSGTWPIAWQMTIDIPEGGRPMSASDSPELATLAVATSSVSSARGPASGRFAPRRAAMRRAASRSGCSSSPRLTLLAVSRVAWAYAT